MGRQRDQELSFSQQVTFLYTEDLDATTAFYEGVLGLVRALDQDGCRIWRVSPGAFLGFCERAGGRPDGIIVTFVDEDVEGRVRQLAERGVTFEKELAYNPRYDITNAFFRDPNGYLLEVQRFESPEWPRG